MTQKQKPFQKEFDKKIKKSNKTSDNYVSIKPVTPLTKSHISYEPDMVNHPPHYNNTPNGIETIDAIIALMKNRDEVIGYLKGTIAKYLSRAGLKDNAVQDVQKAQWYMNMLVEFMEDN